MKSNKRYLLVALVLLLATLLISGLALAEETVAIKSIKLDKTAYEAKLSYGDPVYFECGPKVEGDVQYYDILFTVEPADYTRTGVRFIVTTSNKDVSYAYGNELWGYEVGTTDITIRALDKNGAILAESDKATVTLKEVPVEKLVYNTLCGTPAEIDVDETGNMRNLNGYRPITVEPEDATYGFNDLTWSTTDTEVLRLSTSGDYKALKTGEATVKVTSKGANPKSTEFKVKVVSDPITAISFTPDSFTVDRTTGSYDNLYDIGKYLVVEPDYYYLWCKKVTWSSSDKNIAYVTVGEYGDIFDPDDWYVAFGGNPGTATLTLTITNDDNSTLSTSITVTVLQDTITSLKFQKDEYTLEAEGGYIELEDELIAKPDDVSFWYNGEYDLLWSSSDETVAIVDKYGDVHAKKPGTATITVKCKHDETITASTKIIVSNKPVSKVKMPETLELSYASSTPQRIEFTFEPYDAYIEDVTWVSSDATVIQLQDEPNSYGNGKGYTYIYAKKAGTATVTVKVNDGTSVHEASCVVTVKKESASTLKLNKKKVTLYLSKSASANEKVYLLKAYDKTKELGYEDVTWSSNKKNVVSVDRNGYLTVHAKGKATITATTKDGTGLTAKCTVEVKKENLKSISGNKKITMRVGKKMTLAEMIYDETISFNPSLEKVYDTDLIFKSSNRNVVSVNKTTGTLFANKVGDAEITVTSKANKKVTFTFKVKVIEAQQ